MFPWNEYKKNTIITYRNNTIDTVQNVIYATQQPTYYFDTITGDMRRLFFRCVNDRVADSVYLVIVAKDVKRYESCK